jgi:signal transduction histidine kinase
VRFRRLLANRRDEVIALAVGLIFVTEVWFAGIVEDDRRDSAAIVAALMSGTLVVRRSIPVLGLLTAILVIQLNHTIFVGMAEGAGFLIAVLLTLFAAGSYTSGIQRVVAALLTLAIIPLALFDPRQPPTAGDFVWFLAFLGTPFVGGVIFRIRRQRDADMTERAAAAEKHAGEAVADERARIARELHDVVSHAIGVVVVQSRAGRRVLADSETEARHAFDAIEQAGEQALLEMRHLMALLREAPDEKSPELSPRPGLGRIDELAEGFHALGLPVRIIVEGSPHGLPAGVDLSAYRIVQEALTNVLKHAGPAEAEVILRHRPDGLDIAVMDTGDGSGAGGGSGHGLAGIRERVAVFGGTFAAGPRPDGGYEVRASLPVGGES